MQDIRVEKSTICLYCSEVTVPVFFNGKKLIQRKLIAFKCEHCGKFFKRDWKYWWCPHCEEDLMGLGINWKNQIDYLNKLGVL